jgi:hypothetical protein
MTIAPTAIDLFDEAECARAIADIDALRSYWLRLHDDRLGDPLPDYTLGVSITHVARKIYADQRLRDYAALAAIAHDVLDAPFGWLYQKVCAALEAHHGAPFRVAPPYAPPGFHICYSHPRLAEVLSPVQLDCPYLDLQFEGTDVDYERPLSVTVALELPSGNGGGIHFWDLHLHDLQDLPEAEKVRRFRAGMWDLQSQRALVEKEMADGRLRPALAQCTPYRRGQMVTHSGHHFHQAVPMRQHVAGERRVTLQAHALRVDGVWRLYW